MGESENTEECLMSLAWRPPAWLRVPGILMLVGSLLAGSAFPVAARDGEPDELPEYSACVGAALESAGFGDLGGFSKETRDAISCLAHYRITVGTSSRMYSPRAEVSRLQMALFLIRAARPAGIDVPDPSDQGFIDIGGLSSAVQDAINQLAELGLTEGKTARTFAPDKVVTRRQMAQFLARFLDLAPVGVGGVDIEDVDPDDDIFDDLGELPISSYKAVITLFEMGVTEGTSDTRFSPEAPVTRAQMASFITRMLAHTNARPSGISLQPEDTTVFAESSNEIVLSVRNRYQRPVEDASVDLFTAPARGDVFDEDDRCDEDEVTPEFGDDPCVIDRGDETTDEDGNIVYDLEVDDDLILYAWTGDLRDRFDLDNTDYVSVEYSAVKPAVAFEVTDDMHPEALMVPYGRRVTFTFQLVDEDREPVAEEDVAITVRSEEETDDRLIRRRTRTYDTDSSGRFELDFRIDRPRSNSDTVSGYLDLEVTDSDLPDVNDETAVGILDGNVQLVWSGEDEAPTTLVLEQSVSYSRATSSGSGGRNTVTATLVDQYGDPVRSEKIHFFSDDPAGLHRDTSDPNVAQAKYQRTTNRRGEAAVRYGRDSDQAGTETIWAISEDDDIRSAEDNDLLHYWVRSAPERTLTNYDVLVHDEDRNTLVVGTSSDGPYVITYDSEDQFNEGTRGESPESFAKNLEEGDTVDIEVQSHDRDDINTFTRYSA